MLIAALFITAKKWRQPKCPSVRNEKTNGANPCKWNTVWS